MSSPSIAPRKAALAGTIHSICPVANINCGTSGGITVGADAFGTFRQRVGYAWGQVLFYETAGVAWAVAHPRIVVTACSPGDQSCQVGAFEERRISTGFAAGGGVEIAASPDVSVKAEYLYLDFPNKNFLSGTTQRGAADVSIHTFKVGVNWLLH